MEREPINYEYKVTIRREGPGDELFAVEAIINGHELKSYAEPWEALSGLCQRLVDQVQASEMKPRISLIR